MYGAMLAGVDGIIVGAGNPDGLPKVCFLFTTHQQVTHPIVVLYRESGEDFQLVFDPKTFADGVFTHKPLTRPAFLAIVSSENLASSLAQSLSEKPDGFVIEHHTAGGHNASPQGPLILDDRGQPVYGEEDEPDFDSIRQTGLPFWLAVVTAPVRKFKLHKPGRKWRAGWVNICLIAGIRSPTLS